MEAQKSLRKLKRVTISDFRGGSENAGLSSGQASLQNTRITVSIPTKMQCIASCHLPQRSLVKWDYFPNGPHCGGSPCLHVLSPGHHGMGKVPQEEVKTLSYETIAWVGLPSPQQATWPAACPLPGTDPYPGWLVSTGKELSPCSKGKMQPPENNFETGEYNLAPHSFLRGRA